MDYSFTKDQVLVRKSAKEFFEKECPKDRTRELLADKKGFDKRMWKKMAELGFLGLVMPDEYEGMGGDFIELAILMEEMGRNIVPGPFFTTVCLCAMGLSAFGTGKQKEKFLPRIASKGEIWSLALNEAAVDYTPADIQLEASPDENTFVLDGTKLFVPYASVAKHLLVAARTGGKTDGEEGITVFVVDTKVKGLRVEEIPTAAPDKKFAIHFENVVVDDADMLGEIGQGWAVVEHMLQIGAVLKAAEMAGGAQAALDMAVRYAKERIQFDRPIAANQVLQHKLVNMLTDVDSLRNQVYEAAWNISAGYASILLNSAAKLKANQVYQKVCADAVVIHGAIGWTAEMDISLYLLRAKDLENDCGGSDYHAERVARELEASNPFLSTQSA
jgi:alkylation response protein AidB-like acyl-CoA dehydrogenase